jgi:hypothetical protein
MYILAEGAFRRMRFSVFLVRFFSSKVKRKLHIIQMQILSQSITFKKFVYQKTA